MAESFWARLWNRLTGRASQSSYARGDADRPFVRPGRPLVGAGMKLEGAGSRVGRLDTSEYDDSDDEAEQLHYLADYGPDASLAVWNFLRLGNQGHYVDVFTPSGKPDEKGYQLLIDLQKRLGTEYGGGVDQLLNVYFFSLLVYGAAASEIEVSRDRRDVVDFHPVLPTYIDFKRDSQLKLYSIYNGDSKERPLNPEQFRYVPLDASVGNPYGRTPLRSLNGSSEFQSQVLEDIKTVAHMQGFGRLGVKVIGELLMQSVPEHLKAPGAEADLQTWIDNYLDAIKGELEALNADDALIYLDSMEPSMFGADHRSDMDMRGLMEVVDTQYAASLKTPPLLLGRATGTTETHATVTWQIFSLGIEALRMPVKQLMEWQYTQALRVWGRQASVVVGFEPLRRWDREAEARAEMMETETKILQVQAGWIDNDEAANTLIGHDAVADMQPYLQQGSPPNAGAPGGATGGPSGSPSGGDAGSGGGDDTASGSGDPASDAGTKGARMKGRRKR